MAVLITKGQRLEAKLAITADEQRIGLMHVPWPPPIMIFAYNDSSIRKFWMKNTPSPLDIIFCNKNKVIYIECGKPFDETHIGPDKPADLIIEGPLGFAKEYGIKIGSDIGFHLNPHEWKKINKYLKQTIKR